MKALFAVLIAFFFVLSTDDVDIKNTRIEGDFKVPNSIAPLDYSDDVIYQTSATKYIPVKDEFFTEHVRVLPDADEERRITLQFGTRQKDNQQSPYAKNMKQLVNAVQERGNEVYIGTNKGLYIYDKSTKKRVYHESYGINGPLASSVTALALDKKGTLWIGTPVGLSALKADGTWLSLRGADGLPVEDITALAIDNRDLIWIGTTQGSILYTPYEEGRKFYYRAGKRYLSDDHVFDIIINETSTSIYFKVGTGISRIDEIPRTLAQKAEIMEARLNKWHRREGLVAKCILNDPENPTSHTIPDNDNDGLWTAYHVVAMSLAYGATGDKAYLESASEGMHALIMLQNASGIPGLVARSVVPIGERSKKSEQWRPTPDGKWLWKSDTSSDEIDGHFFAFYAYWEHIARHDPAETELIRKQAGTVMSYIADHNYQLIDWDGERTTWGFWNPELINDNPEHYLENGLNSAQILSHLKVTWYITGDDKFKQHYDRLITEHGYLANVMLEKKVHPDANNHSDNQLGYCALYPLFQLEYDPRARDILQRTARRHYRTLDRDGSAFFYFATATIDPDFVDIKSAMLNLQQIPTDRREWRMVNSNRKDIVWSPYLDRFERKQLLNVLPVDERNWDKWNGNPYYADGGGDGREEDDGASWMLAYWMGRYHGFIGPGE